jgi:hypothetical protein
MTIEDFTKRIGGMISELISTREEESIIIANDAMALVRNRVQNDKEDADGSEFGEYSEAVVPRWMLYGKSLSEGAEEKVKKGGWFQSYADLREANNLPTDAIDFTFTGDLMRNLGIVTIKNTQYATRVTLGGQTTRAAEILSHQAERHGNIIAISEDEAQMVKEAHEERFSNLVSKYLG